MRISGNTALVADSGSGMGVAAATALLRAGNQVILFGKCQARLDEALAHTPALQTYTCDATDPAQRKELLDLVRRHFPRLNILVNDAALAEIASLADLNAAERITDELVHDLQAPVQLTLLLLPHLLRQREAAVINVAAPAAFANPHSYPAFRAAHAGLRSFAQSLRTHLNGTSVSVIEIPSSLSREPSAGESTTHFSPAEAAALLINELQKVDSRSGRPGRWLTAFGRFASWIARDSAGW